MTSINTNNSAMFALQTLRSINKELESYLRIYGSEGTISVNTVK